MKKILIILFIALVSCIYASGEKEKTICVDLGTISVKPDVEYYSFLIPYVKPDGVCEIPIVQDTGMQVHNLVIDGKKIHPNKLLFFGPFDSFGKKTVDSSKQEHLLLVELLSFIADGNEESVLEALTFYTDLFERIPKQYRIPYGATDIYMEYSIRYPPTDTEYSKETKKKMEQKYAVRWTMSWPKLGE